MRHVEGPAPIRRAIAIALLCVCAAAPLILGACAGTGGGQRVRSNRYERDPALARQLHAEATRIAEDQPERAEELLRESIRADLYHGPAHNNLGILLLQQGQLYEAAEEFEWARKLMPGHPDPRVNLAITLQKAGMHERALEAYTAALEVYPSYLPALQGIARLQVESGRTDESTIAALHEIGLRGDEQWRAWAQFWKTKLEHAAQQ